MGYSKTIYYQNRTFAAGELARAIEQIIRKFGADPTATNITVQKQLPDGTRLDRSNATISDLEELCDLIGGEIRFWFTGEGGSRRYLSIAGGSDTIRVYLDADQASKLAPYVDDVKQILDLEDPPPPEQIAIAVKSGFEEALRPIEERLKSVEDAIFAPRRRLRCFLSYRFTSANEIVALRIQQFLAALDVEVITGATYEPRRISEKVLSRLRDPLDFIVLLVTSDGESMWTRDEIGAAAHHDLAIVPIVELGADFKSGLFGDLEYIPYTNDHVGDAFLHLLQAVNFIREQKAGRSDPAPESSEA